MYYRSNTLAGSCLFGDFERVHELATPEAILTRDLFSSRLPMTAAIYSGDVSIVELFAKTAPESINDETIKDCILKQNPHMFQVFLDNG